MTGNSLVLDTNVVIDLFKKREQVLTVVAQTPEICIPVVVLGELVLGAFRSVNKEAKVQEINDFLLTCRILELDKTTATFYANAKASLLQKGRPIPDNDIWIAATALQHDLSLFTSDIHFREIDGLQIFNPLTSV